MSKRQKRRMKRGREWEETQESDQAYYSLLLSTHTHTHDFVMSEKVQRGEEELGVTGEVKL